MRMTESEFTKLLDAARAGEQSAIAQVMELFRHYLSCIAQTELDSDLLRKVGASDVVQDTLLEAHRHFDRFVGEEQDQLLAWLRKILLNNIMDTRKAFQQAGCRQIQLEVRIDDSRNFESVCEDAPSPSQQAIQHEQAEALQAAMAQLSPDYRQVLEWHHRDHLSFVEIAQRLDRSPDAIRMLWKRAIEKLQEVLTEST